MKSLILSLLAGGLCVFSFAPFHYPLLSFIGVFLFLYVLFNARSLRHAALLGWGFGLGLFGLGVSWVYFSIHQFGGLSPVASAGLTLLFVMVLAVFPLFKALLIQRLKSLPFWFVAPAIWVGVDYLRVSFFSGFPWLYIGYSQLGWPRAGYAPLTGVYGVSFFLVWSAALLTLLIKEKRRSKAACLSVFSLILVWAVGAFLGTVHWTTQRKPALQAILVQGQVPIQMKWDQVRFQQQLTHYLKLTKPYLKPGSLVIWPENSVPLLDFDAHVYPFLQSMAKNHGIGLIVGAPLRPFPNRAYNSMVGFGMVEQLYFKRKLVPFGETWPQWLFWLKPFFGIPGGLFSPGPLQQEPMRFGDTRFASFICYEVAFPELVRSSSQRAQFLVAISEDSWFGDSIARDQQIQMVQMRALELGRYFLNADNSGVTAIINAQGKIIKEAPLGTAAVIHAPFYRYTGQTLWAAWGSWMVVMLYVLWGLFALYAWRPSQANDRLCSVESLPKID